VGALAVAEGDGLAPLFGCPIPVACEGEAPTGGAEPPTLPPPGLATAASVAGGLVGGLISPTEGGDGEEPVLGPATDDAVPWSGPEPLCLPVRAAIARRAIAAAATAARTSMRLRRWSLVTSGLNFRQPFPWSPRAGCPLSLRRTEGANSCRGRPRSRLQTPTAPLYDVRATSKDRSNRQQADERHAARAEVPQARGGSVGVYGCGRGPCIWLA
jgi:hypothetical protein